MATACKHRSVILCASFYRYLTAHLQQAAAWLATGNGNARFILNTKHIHAAELCNVCQQFRYQHVSDVAGHRLFFLLLNQQQHQCTEGTQQQQQRPFNGL